MNFSSRLLSGFFDVRVDLVQQHVSVVVLELHRLGQQLVVLKIGFDLDLEKLRKCQLAIV